MCGDGPSVEMGVAISQLDMSGISAHFLIFSKSHTHTHTFLHAHLHTPHAHMQRTDSLEISTLLWINNLLLRLVQDYMSVSYSPNLHTV